VENVFENNYESSNRAKDDNVNMNINASPIPSSPLQVPKLYEIGNYTPNHHNTNNSNSKITIEQLEIYKTLEQRVNMLERELNMQKMNNNNNSNNSNSKHYSSNSSLHTIANTYTDTNNNNEKIRPKSGGKCTYEKEMGDMCNGNDGGITPVLLMDKPKKTIKKKKKKINKRENNSNNVVNTNMTNNDGKGSVCSNISNTNNNNKNNIYNRCVTPVHSRKIGLNRNNSNNNNIHVCKSKGGHLHKKAQY
jgi:hypothetical protein